VDLIIETKKKSLKSSSEFITIEIKHSKTWNTNFNKMSILLKEKLPK